MATHWLREITTTATGVSTGFPFGSKVLALYLRHVLGCTNNAEVVDSIGVGNSVTVPEGANKHQRNDTDAAGGRFVAADVGKTITITNMVDPNNNGAFTITDYVSATAIKYVNAAGSAETSSFDWTITVGDESFWSTEKNGVNGSINITGTDKNFQDTTAAAFVGGDTGKWLLLVDNTNPRNSGLYKVTYVDASNVTLDFRSGAAEYPTQNLGANLSWWLLGDTYQVPTRRDSYWRLRTPHTTGWEIEVKWSDAGADQGFQVRLAVDANWGGTKILGPAYMGVDDNDATWFYCAGNTEGEFINFFFHNSTNNQWGGFIAADVDLFDADRTADEAVALMGNPNSSTSIWPATSTYEKVQDATNVANGWIWSDRPPNTVQTCSMVEMSYLNSDLGFTQWTSAQANARISATQFIEGQPIIVDPNNVASLGEYEIVGSLKGVFGAHRGTDKTAHTDPNDSGTLNRFHVFDGLGVEWPNVTAQH
jgi:hypothetical protein